MRRRRTRVRDSYSEDVLWDTIETYNIVAGVYRRRPWGIVEKAMASDTIVFADMGCGPGHNTIYLLQQHPGTKAVLIDLSKEMVRIGYRRACRKKLSYRVLPLVADLRELPLRDNSLDSLIYIASLHHIPLREGRARALREAYRVLRRGGRILITVWARWQLYFLLRLVVNAVKKIINPGRPVGDVVVYWRHHGIKLRRYYYLYTLSELVEEVVKTGFKIIEKGVYRPSLKRSITKPLKNYYVLGIKE